MISPAIKVKAVTIIAQAKELYREPRASFPKHFRAIEFTCKEDESLNVLFVFRKSNLGSEAHKRQTKKKTMVKKSLNNVYNDFCLLFFLLQ